MFESSQISADYETFLTVLTVSQYLSGKSTDTLSQRPCVRFPVEAVRTFRNRQSIFFEIYHILTFILILKRFLQC